MSTVKRLSGFNQEVQPKGYAPANIRKLRELAVNGVVPAFQINYIWHFYTSDTVAIAEILGLERVNAAETSHKAA